MNATEHEKFLKGENAKHIGNQKRAFACLIELGMDVSKMKLDLNLFMLMLKIENDEVVEQRCEAIPFTDLHADTLNVVKAMSATEKRELRNRVMGHAA